MLKSLICPRCNNNQFYVDLGLQEVKAVCTCCQLEVGFETKDVTLQEVSGMDKAFTLHPLPVEEP